MDDKEFGTSSITPEEINNAAVSAAKSISRLKQSGYVKTADVLSSYAIIFPDEESYNDPNHIAVSDMTVAYVGKYFEGTEELAKAQAIVNKEYDKNVDPVKVKKGLDTLKEMADLPTGELESRVDEMIQTSIEWMMRDEEVNSEVDEPLRSAVKHLDSYADKSYKTQYMLKRHAGLLEASGEITQRLASTNNSDTV